MIREEFARKIHWSKIVWTFGLINVMAMLPQMWQLIHTRETIGLSLEMFVLYFVIQIAFSLQGFFNRDKMLMWCLGLSAAVSATIISTIVYLRH